MMAAYQPQPGMHPGGMPAHGHPGMAPTPGGHMGQPMMQHQGVTGPGQPHVAQAGPMMGMQPGAGIPGAHHPGAAGGMGVPGQPGQGMGGQSMAGGAPNAHAMSHLNPQQATMMQQHQMQQMQGASAQFALQQHQAQMMRQRQIQLMQQAQQMGFPPAQVQGMNLQQLQQLIQSNGSNVPGPQQVQLPAHLMQQQQMLRMQQQQAQAQQQQQAQANQQLQQQMAMQQANSQQSHQSQQGSAAQQNQPGQPPQMRPGSRMANPNEQNQGAQPQQGQPPAPGQPQHQNSSQGQPPQGQPQQNMAQQQAEQLQQFRRTQFVQQHQQQQQQQHQQQQQQQQQEQQQRQQHQQQQEQQQRQQHQQQQQQQQQQQLQQQNNARQIQASQMQAAQGPQAQPSQTGGHFILRIMLLGDQLSSFNATNGKDMAEWNSFVDKHFSPDGRLLHRFANDADPNGKTKTYEVLRPTIARYFWTYFESGASSLRLHTENARETTLASGRCHLSCSTATLTVSYPSGARLEMHGSLNVLFAPSTNIIECLDLQQTKTEDIVSRSEIEKVLATFSPTLSTKSPKMTKNKLPKAQQKLQQQFDGLTIDHFPKAPKGSMGVTSRVQQFLEIGETMNVMSVLMAFANEKGLRPEQALDTLVAQYEAQGAQRNNPQMNMPPNGIAMGQRTPSMQHMQMPQGGNFSPSVSNLNLPNGMTGSPHLANNPGLQANMMQPNSHTPSPHQSNMAAPMMMPQHSQQGTNSSAASANTSPNTNNKRRRSTVKLEDDGPDGHNAGQRVKPSPRMNKKSKPGG